MKNMLMLSLTTLALITALSPAADAHHGPAHAQTAAALSSPAASKPLIVYFFPDRKHKNRRRYDPAAYRRGYF